MLEFTPVLLQWYEQNHRNLPWRNTSDPYKIWLSEIILQQTRIAQGLSYYKRFVERYPTIFDLADASEDEVLKLWQGLGYYSRARNLHYTAQIITEDYHGVFPNTYQELKKLKGIGDYTASAIASICFDEPNAVLDGNVFRVLARFFGISTPTNTTEGRKIFKSKAQEYLDLSEPGKYNEAIMEFGALQCKPKSPLCMNCPLQNECIAFQQGKIKKLPIKLKKVKVRKRHFNYLVFVSKEGETFLQKRTGKDIWRNLYEFPLIESQDTLQKTAFMRNEALSSLCLKPEGVELFNEKVIKHQLTHQQLWVKFWIIRIPNLRKYDFHRNTERIKTSEIDNFAIPAVIEKFLNIFDF